MPGPVSDSYEPSPPKNIRDEWIAHIRKEGTKYFVVKAEEFLQAIDPTDAEYFSDMLRLLEEVRAAAGKKPFNRYWIVNRDEPWAAEVEAIMRKHIPNLGVPEEKR